ncbi:GDSL-type esterase/lipase family protein [Suttonella sp. R2A3]|uniref:GDSL-type esterase/lipase family protein n=1 Tax=Suttonella sp. R2A3 TaxID=2908648 RepID=UPI001F15F0B8|nr:GDSL-type esterase/lipase family protein [Suttonella sp. R2A3]UJF23796.1 GDSL-type esterase/lipase family protein [Suttonella sp. R2A3]
MINRRNLLILALCAGLAAILWLFRSDEPIAQQPPLPNNARIVALGDSLTYGFGALRGQDYPAVLAELSELEVINMGVNGDTSADVLARIDAVIAIHPDLVLLGVGGNDVLQRVDPQATKRHIAQTIEALAQADIAVLLIAEPHFSASNMIGIARDNPIYAELAASHDLALFADQWSQILSDEALKSDEIHANADGYRQFARALYQFLQVVGYL